MIDSFDVPPDEAFIDAQRLPRLLDLYLADIRGRVINISRKKYRQKIAHFIRWSNGYSVIARRDFADFTDYLAASSLKSTTQADVIKRVSQMFTWAHRASVAKLDYSLWLPSINAPKTIFNPVSPGDVQAMLTACLFTRYADRNRAMIAVMAGAGLRLEETVALDTGDLHFDATGAGSLVVRRGKGSKSRVVAFKATYGAHLRYWLDQLVANRPLLNSQKGDRLTTSGAYNEFKRIAAKAGLSLSCHDMRRHYATQWIIEHPGRYVELQKMMGHSDFSTTANYIWLTQNHIESLVNG